MSYQYQVVVIGSGSAGKEACLAAAKAGVKTLLVEEEDLGGTSVHGGSHAMRALRVCATEYKRIQKGRKAGTSVSLINADWSDWLAAKLQNSNRLSAEISKAIEHGWYVLIYVLSMLALAYHLLHGFFSAARSLGIYHPRYVRLVKAAGWVYSIGIGAGFAFIPVFIYFVRH